MVKDSLSKKRIFVGLSGGVDSSVAALLLKQEGHNVTGVFIKAWQPDFLPCTWKEERQSAMRVAAHLGISFKTYDLSQEYKQEVFDNMLESYARGETPNPDVRCNERIKFGVFFSRARREGADAVATGHYARVTKDTHGVARLLKAKDSMKDQTYFLARVSQEALLRTLFPIGHLEKEDVRRLAAQSNLPTAKKKDSQGLCFIGALDMKSFLRETIHHEPGLILNLRGEHIGRHEGAALYTLGERLGITDHTHRALGEPLFVVAKDVVANTLTVARKGETRGDLQIYIHSLHEIVPGTILEQKTYTVRYRYRQPLIEASVIQKDGRNCIIRFRELQRDLAPGQLLVLYDTDECLGGGTIGNPTLR